MDGGKIYSFAPDTFKDQNQQINYLGYGFFGKTVIKKKIV